MPPKTLPRPPGRKSHARRRRRSRCTAPSGRSPSAVPIRSRSTPSRINSRGPVAGVNGHRGLQLRVIAPAGTLMSVRPAAVEDVLALRMRFQIAGHDADDLAAEPCQEMPRTPAGAGAGRAGSFGGGKNAWKRRGYRQVLNWRRSRFEARLQPACRDCRDCLGSPNGLAQASHSAALMSLAEGTASRVISDDAI